MENRSPLVSVAVSLLVLCLAAVPAAAEPGDVAIGFKGGLNWSLLQRPTDPPDSPTLMHGTAFDGVGGTVGPTLEVDVGALVDGPLSLEFDAMYSRHVGHGFEKHGETDARRDVTLTTDAVRVPLLLKWQLPDTETSPILVGIGPELWAGLRSGATVTHNEAIDQPPEPLRTTPVRHLTLTALLGFEIEAGPDAAIPIELRTAWDPMVGASTKQRFRSWESYDNPGAYEIAFDLHVIAMTGFTWQGL